MSIKLSYQEYKIQRLTEYFEGHAGRPGQVGGSVARRKTQSEEGEEPPTPSKGLKTRKSPRPWHIPIYFKGPWGIAINFFVPDKKRPKEIPLVGKDISPKRSAFPPGEWIDKHAIEPVLSFIKDLLIPQEVEHELLKPIARFVGDILHDMSYDQAGALTKDIASMVQWIIALELRGQSLAMQRYPYTPYQSTLPGQRAWIDTETGEVLPMSFSPPAGAPSRYLADFPPSTRQQRTPFSQTLLGRAASWVINPYSIGTAAATIIGLRYVLPGTAKLLQDYGKEPKKESIKESSNNLTNIFEGYHKLFKENMLHKGLLLQVANNLADQMRDLSKDQKSEVFHLYLLYLTYLSQQEDLGKLKNETELPDLPSSYIDQLERPRDYQKLKPIILNIATLIFFKFSIPFLEMYSKLADK